jgi:hypothetical protein
MRVSLHIPHKSHEAATAWFRQCSPVRNARPAQVKWSYLTKGGELYAVRDLFKRPAASLSSVLHIRVGITVSGDCGLRG